MSDDLNEATDRLRDSAGDDPPKDEEKGPGGKIKEAAESVKDSLTSDADEKADAEDEGATDLRHQDLLG